MTANRPVQTATMLACATLVFASLSREAVRCEDSLRSQDKSPADSVFRQLDKSGDGVLSMDEATVGTRSFLERIFKAAGKSPGDTVTREEFSKAQEQLRSKSPTSSAKSATANPSAADSARAANKEPPNGIGFIDTSGDGAISRGEWSKLAQAFRSLDVDKDNSLSGDELQATGGAQELLIKLGDADADGQISRAEWIGLSQSFARFDTNQDKSLDLAELEKAAEAMTVAASGAASLGGNKAVTNSGPTLWRGAIEGRGGIELLVNGNLVVGREYGPDGPGGSLGAGRIMMTGDGKSGNMDAVYTAGPQAGQVCLGIYRLEGDNLLWCVNNRGWRPLLFTATTGDWLMTLTRVDMEPTPDSKAR
jgi:uncharacterized protein (TIGR03067 family)